MTISDRIAAQSQSAIFAQGLIMALALGVFDFHSGPDFSVAALYMIPVTWTTWFLGRAAGHAIAFISAAAWFYGLHLVVPWEIDMHPLIIAWNFVTGLAIFAMQVHILSALRVLLVRETLAARTDFLTGSSNARNFYDNAGRLIALCGERALPCTFAYVDVDHFKQVNDNLGHEEGDRLLKAVAALLRESVRKGDEVARLGGDEFALMLAGADEREAAEVARRLRSGLIQMKQEAGWPVSFSMGMVTYLADPPDLKEVLRQADHLMYEVKRQGRSDIRHEVVPSGAVSLNVELGEPAAGKPEPTPPSCPSAA